MVRTCGSSSTTRIRAVRHCRREARSSACARDPDARGATCGRTKFNAKPGSSHLSRRRSEWRNKTSNDGNAALCLCQFSNGRTDTAFKFVSSNFEMARSAKEAKKNLPKALDGSYFGARSNSCRKRRPDSTSHPIPSKIWKALDADRTKENLPMPGLELATELL